MNIPPRHFAWTVVPGRIFHCWVGKWKEKAMQLLGLFKRYSEICGQMRLQTILLHASEIVRLIESIDTPKYAGKLCLGVAINFVFMPATLWLKSRNHTKTKQLGFPTHCPLVQPLPILVPNPTRKPLTMYPNGDTMLILGSAPRDASTSASPSMYVT